VLTDINETAIQQLVSKVPPGRAVAQKLNLFEPTELSGTIQGAALVVLGAGPYSQTSDLYSKHASMQMFHTLILMTMWKAHKLHLICINKLKQRVPLATLGAKRRLV